MADWRLAINNNMTDYFVLLVTDTLCKRNIPHVEKHFLYMVKHVIEHHLGYCNSSYSHYAFNKAHFVFVLELIYIICFCTVDRNTKRCCPGRGSRKTADVFHPYPTGHR